MQIKKFDSINVVPFIDIMLVLLVIVLTTATFVAKGIIPVELPQASASQKQKEEKNLIISIKNDGKIFFEKEQISMKNFETKLNTYKKTIPIHINCDKEAKFDSFVQILDILKAKEYTNLGIMTQEK